MEDMFLLFWAANDDVRQLQQHKESATILSVRREDNSERVRNLERQIAEIDAEIDQRVYELSGLTQEEIRIVEE